VRTCFRTGLVVIPGSPTGTIPHTFIKLTVSLCCGHAAAWLTPIPLKRPYLKHVYKLPHTDRLPSCCIIRRLLSYCIIRIVGCCTGTFGVLAGGKAKTALDDILAALAAAGLAAAAAAVAAQAAANALAAASSITFQLLMNAAQALFGAASALAAVVGTTEAVMLPIELDKMQRMQQTSCLHQLQHQLLRCQRQLLRCQHQPVKASLTLTTSSCCFDATRQVHP
jgi:hypothetical protein